MTREKQQQTAAEEISMLHFNDPARKRDPLLPARSEYVTPLSFAGIHTRALCSSISVEIKTDTL